MLKRLKFAIEYYMKGGKHTYTYNNPVGMIIIHILIGGLFKNPKFKHEENRIEL